MTTWIISGVLGFSAGGAIGFIFKEKIQGLVIDANTLSAKLHAKANEIASKAKR